MGDAGISGRWLRGRCWPLTVISLVAAAVIAGLGTRLAVPAFAVAAAIGASTGGSLAPVAAWTSALAAGSVLLGIPARRVAPLAFGAAAVLAAGSSANAAAVLTAWIVGTAGAVLWRGQSPNGRGWALGLLLADLPVAAGVIYTATSHGFVDWPLTLDRTGVLLLAAGALLRVPLVTGPPSSPEAGATVIRAQIAVLGIVALGSSTPRDLALGVLLAGAAVFALATLAKATSRDPIQEAGLILATVGAAAAGLHPGGWVWGVLAGGTLLYHFKLRTFEVSGLGRAVLRGSGFAWPLLPAVAAVAAAGADRRGWISGAVVVCLAIGLWGRGARAALDPAPAADTQLLRVSATAIVCMGVAAALWAPLLTLPRPPGAGGLPWPPILAGFFVLAAGGIGWYVPGGRLAPAEEPRSAAGTLPRVFTAVRIPSVVRRLPERRGALVGPFAALAAAAVGLWLLGWARGFL